jgi:hypothetical protein
VMVNAASSGASAGNSGVAAFGAIVLTGILATSFAADLGDIAAFRFAAVHSAGATVSLTAQGLVLP